MSRWLLIVAVLFVLVGGGFSFGLAQDAGREASVGGTPCPMGPTDASPATMASPIVMAEGTPIMVACATPAMGGMEMGTPTS